MFSKLSGGPMLVVLLMVTLAAVTLGGAQGYQADSPAETKMYIEGDQFVVGDNSTNISFEQNRNQNLSRDDRFGGEPIVDLNASQYLPDQFVDGYEGMAMSVVESMHWGAMYYAVGVADATASWTYANQWWFPAWAFRGLVDGALLGIIGVAVYPAAKSAIGEIR